MKPVLHFSHISSMFNCGEKFRRKYVERDRESPGTGLVVGGVSHEVIEQNMKFKIAQRKLLPIETCREIAKIEFEKRWIGVHFTAKEIDNGAEVTKSECFSKTLELVDLFYNELAPTIQPKMVEQPWRLELRNSPFDLAGTFDLVTTDDELLDFKHVGKSPGKNEANASDQLTFYSLAYMATYGVIPNCRLISLVKSKKVKVVDQPTARTTDDFAVLRRRIEMAYKAISTGVFLPAPQNSWQCSTSFCSFASANDCKFFRSSSSRDEQTEE